MAEIIFFKIFLKFNNKIMFFKIFVKFNEYFSRTLVKFWCLWKYCKCYNYRRNGSVAVPGLFISSGRKQGGNYSEWRSRKKKTCENASAAKMKSGWH